MAKSAFRNALESAVLERHCANHPMTDKWAKGELGRPAMRGWAVEHYHWVSNIMGAFFDICARAPQDVVRAQLENYFEEMDDDRPHLGIVLRFAEANGANLAEVRKGTGLPTTRAWVRFLNDAAREPSWIAGVAAINIGTESQSPMLYTKVLPALRKVYKFEEPAIEHFWLHSEADIEHGGRAFDVLEHHCKTTEQQDLAVHWARESAKMRWLYFDGIYLHYEMGYALA